MLYDLLFAKHNHSLAEEEEEEAVAEVVVDPVGIESLDLLPEKSVISEVEIVMRQTLFVLLHVSSRYGPIQEPILSLISG